MKTTLENISVGFNDSVLSELIEQEHVESEKVIQLIQLMAMPEFKRFFEALCNVDVERIDPTAMATCLERFGRIDYDLDALWRERNEDDRESATPKPDRSPFCPISEDD